jgi:protein involved in polysaccharide export with SLBB domain
MTHLKREAQKNRWGLLAILSASALLVAGCFTTPNPISYDPPSPDTAALALRVGDHVKLSFSGATVAPPPEHEDHVKEDGTINAPQLGPVQARGLTPRQLEKALEERYQDYYRSLTVTVHSNRRLYSVGGEVRQNGRFEWTADTTVLKAVQSAGGFTDFAQRKRVTIHRSNGRVDEVNCVRALNDPRYDVPIFPCDTVNVPRRGI